MWYVIQVPTGKENQIRDICEERLEDDIYKEIFIFRYTRKIKVRGKWQEVVRTLFPGYIFIDTEKIDEVRISLRNVQSMTIVLGSNNEPVPVTEEEQKFLQSLVDDQFIVRMSTGFIIGDYIALTTGPLRSTKGIIRKINRHKREAEIDVELFGGVTKAVVGLEVIKKVTEEEFLKLQEEAVKDERNVIQRNGNIQGGSCDSVRILSGVFKGMTGRLLTPPEELAGLDEIEIELNVFGAPSKVVVSADSVMIG